MEISEKKFFVSYMYLLTWRNQDSTLFQTSPYFLRVCSAFANSIETHQPGQSGQADMGPNFCTITNCYLYNNFHTFTCTGLYLNAF